KREEKNKEDRGRKTPRGNYIGYTPLNTSRETILQECANAEFAEAGVRPPRENRENPRTDTTNFCRFHRSAGHDTEDCIQLKYVIGDLIKVGKLGRYTTRGGNSRNYEKRKYDSSRKTPRRSVSPRRKRSPKRDSPPKERIEAITTKEKETEDSKGERDPDKRPFVASITESPVIPVIHPEVQKNDNRSNQTVVQSTTSIMRGPSNPRGRSKGTTKRKIAEMCSVRTSNPSSQQNQRAALGFDDHEYPGGIPNEIFPLIIIATMAHHDVSR
ncbi:hypothetical protein A2U01_0030452, partial [Trifolium medium]|nr:hypothetical protein [Trifolium medium]